MNRAVALDDGGPGSSIAELGSAAGGFCTAAQKRFWVFDQLSPGNPALNVAVRWRLEGEVAHADLEAAFGLIIARHEPLRTSFEAVAGEPLRVVERDLPFHIPSIDLAALPPAEAEAEADRIAAAEARASFDLSVAPLFRVTHLRLEQRVSIILVTAHHIVCDGWSVGLIAEEMGQICAARWNGSAPQLPELPVSYGDYCCWQARHAPASAAAEAGYWKRALANVRYFEMPTDRPHPPVRGNNSEIASTLLPRQLTDAVGGLSRRNGCTLFATVLAALLTLLHRYTGESDIVIGTQVAGRDDSELEALVGLFINTVALRSDLSGDPSFAGLLQRVMETVTDAYEHRQTPLESLIEMVKPRRDPSRNPLFAVNFIFQRSFVHNRNYGPFKLIDMPSRSSGSMYDLNFFMVERPDGWRLSCEYNTDLFEGATVSRFLRHFRNLLQAAAENPAQKLSLLPMLDAAERQELARDWNRTGSAYPDATLTELIDAQTEHTPQAVAAVCGGRAVSYRQLQLDSNRLALHLRQLGAGPSRRVGVLLERSPELLAALLGVLRSGAAYVPLDPAYPRERLLQIMQDAELCAVVSRRQLATPLLEGSGIAAALVDVAEVTAEADGCMPPPRSQDVAYVIYTSGSTGKPKGVAIQHRALVNLLWSMRERPGLGPADTLLSVTTVSFDIAALELFLPLLVGARVVLAREEEAGDGMALRQLLSRYRATVMQATPVTWQLLLEAGWRGDPPLKMLCGGEAMPRVLAEQLLSCGGELWNMYGPTETTIWSSALRVEHGEGPVPLGWAIANTQFYVLDANGELAPPGAPGELYIGGDGVALGYSGLPELSAERFLPDPFRDVPGARMYRTGDMVRITAPRTMEYLGRKDQQVKLRGFRIELGEIEALLRRQAGVADAAATVGRSAAGEPAIWAYAVPEPGVDRERLAAALRDAATRSLPGYMRPSSLLLLESLTRTPNGKIDRKALPAPAVVQHLPPAASSLSGTEARLAAIWCALLGIERIGAEQDFFELGGHSLLAARLQARIDGEFGRRLDLASLFQAPTIRDQARLIERDDLRQYDFRQVIRLHPNGTRVPLIAINNTGVYYYNLAKRLGPDQPVMALQLFDPSLPQTALPGSIEEIAARYVELIRQFQPAGPYALTGWCVGGVLAYEVARQLAASGERVEMVAVIDAWIPGYLSRGPKWRAMLLDWSYRVQLIVADWLKAMSGNGGIKKFIANRTITKRIARGLGLRHVEQQGELPDARASGERHDQWLQTYLDEAARRFTPGTYDGPLTVLRSALEPRFLLDPKMGWGRVASRVQVRLIEGDHFTMFHEPGISRMAGVLLRDMGGARQRELIVAPS